MFSALRASVFAMSLLSTDNRVRLQTRQLFPDGFANELPFVSPVGTRLTAAHFTPRCCRDLRAAAALFDAPLREAAAQGSPFVAFPELSGLALLGLLPRCERVLASLRRRFSAEAGRAGAAREAVQIAQGFLSETFLNMFSVLARGHRMLIAAGGFYVWEEGALRNRQYLFAENGDLLGYQDKMILSDFERAMGVVPCGKLEPMETRIGRIALLTASCARHYEPFAVASGLGCRVATVGASPFGEDLSPLAARAREQALVLVSAGLGASAPFFLSEESAPRVFLPQGGVRSLPADAEGAAALTARVDLSGAPLFDHYTADRNPAFFASLLAGDAPDADAVLVEMGK